MASAQDVLNAVNGANGRLDEVNNRLGGVHTRLDGTNARLDDVKAKLDLVTKSIQDVNTTLNWGFAQLVTIGNYTNQALAQNAAQNDTMICILEHISRNTCESLAAEGFSPDLIRLVDGYGDTGAALIAPRAGSRTDRHR